MDAPVINLCKNPRQGANLLAVLTFWWTYDLFQKGSTKTLDLSDLYEPLKDDYADKLGDRLEKHWTRQLNNHKKNPKKDPSLVKAIFRTFWHDWMLLSIITVFGEIVLRIAQPFLLGRLLLYFRRQTDMTFDEALYFAIGMILTKAASVIVDNQYALITALNGVRTRIAVCNILYRKSLRLSRNALGDTSPGKVVNLMSNDVNRFDIVSYVLSFMWSSPVVTIIVLVLLWYEVGWAGPIGMVVVFIVTPIQSFFGKLTSRYRLQTALKTDERIRLMDEIISGIHVIKMYAWEKPFGILISLARKTELKIVRKSGSIRGMYMTFQLFTTRAALFATMITLILMKEELTAAKVFVVASYLNIVSHVMSGMFVRGVAEIAEALVATRRLQNFLEYEEFDDSKTQTDDVISPGVAISMHSVIARWDPASSDSNSRPPTLNNLNAEFRKGQLIGIVGAIGSGKSSILQAILKELPLESGHILNNETMSYASQEPWLFVGSIRQNILFGSAMDTRRYKTVIRVCALESDLKQFAEGDETLIGDRGVSLSGGQKARVCLARAVYKQSSVYLMDDPLSAVDAHVAKHLFDLCIGAKGFLGKQGATRILVTHQVHFLVQSDWIIVMDEGKIVAQGTPHDLHQHGVDFLELNGSENIECNFSRQSSYSSVNSDCSGTELDYSHEHNIKHMENAFEKTSKDTVDGSMFVHYAAAVENWVIIGGLVSLFIVTQLIVSLTDYWVSFWVSQEELRSYLNEKNATDISYHEPLGTDICAYVQSSIVAGVFIIGLIRALGFYHTCALASQTIHDWSFKGFISATKHFFDTNPSGRILNRFSKDIGVMDELLPKSIMDATQTVLTIIGAMLVIVVVQPFFVIPILLLLGVLLYARKLYLKTSQNSRRLEAITQSPIFSHIATTLNGLPTIRSFSVQKILITEFEQHQNVNTGAVFMFHSCRVAFGMMLDVIFFLFLSVVTFSFLLLDTSALGDKVGLVVTQITSLASLLQFGIRQSANMFNHLIAVERLLEYKDLPAEEQPQTDTALIKSKSWPSEGRIEFIKVNFKYFQDGPTALHDLCFVVEPKQKVGIVGRTGAGKSSIIGALFRSAIVEGSIVIDNVSTDEITLETLRSNISIIPQDPVLFSGTLRKNLDPFDKYPDSVLWHALKLVELSDIASGPLGLQTYVAPGGSNFSVGQRQLVCLARAILRSNKILVLDEATANVDPETDRLIQQTIREHFADCTVLTIAHRLNTIIDYDRILVMSDGSAVEFGSPHELLQIPDGVFRDMLLALGQAEAENLINMAKK